MTTTPAPADDVSLPAIQRTGATLYALNAAGINLWSAQVQPGRTDDDQRLSDAECERIAAVLADRTSPSRAAWIDVAARLPESGKAVLLDIGRGTPLRAVWAAKHTIQAGDEAPDDWAEYVEADDMYYCPEGWYEWNEHEETHWAVSATPLRWMTIPVPAAVDVGTAQAETAQAAPARCSYCDGTGDVHGLDGEWRGECTECSVAITRTFKNFHANLCTRFGYAHDEKGWQRDLVSLEEHIAKLAAQAAPVAPGCDVGYAHFTPFYLLYNARRLLSAEYRRKPNYVIARELFAVGHTSASLICREAGIDPDGLEVRKAATPGATHGN